MLCPTGDALFGQMEKVLKVSKLFDFKNIETLIQIIFTKELNVVILDKA
jgi:hypothetical protein